MMENQIIPVEENLNEELLKYFKGEKDGYVQVGPKKWFLPIKYKKLANDYKNFKIRPDDVWITGIPRSGTTLTQNIAWVLSNNSDYEAFRPDSVAFFENFLVLNDKTMEELMETNEQFKKRFSDETKQPKDILNRLNNTKERRVIKSHLPFELLPSDITEGGCKVIYVCRYPKDVAVSYFHLQSQLPHINYKGDFKKYWEFFKNGNCMFGPYFEHVKQAWHKRNSKNFLFVFFEDFKKNPIEFIKRMAEFLEKPSDQTELEEIMNFFDINKLKKLDGVNDMNIDFVRKGQVGGWKKYFDDEMSETADEWIAKNTFEIGIEYPL